MFHTCEVCFRSHVPEPCCAGCRCGATLCGDSITDRNDEHREYRCALERGHSGPHGDNDGNEWTDGEHW